MITTPLPLPDAPNPPAKPRIWTVAFALFAAVAANLCAGVAVGFTVTVAWVVRLARESGGTRPVEAEVTEQLRALMERPDAKAAMYALGSGIILLVALLAARLGKQPVRERLGLLPDRWGGRPLAYVAVTAGAMAAGQAVLTLQTLAGAGSESLDKFDALLRAAPLGWVVALAFPIVVLAPLGEELLFRGYAQTRLTARFGSGPAIAIVAILFGLVHLDPVHAFAAAGIGVFLGWARERAGSVRPVIVAHAVNNLVAVVAARSGAEAPEGAVALAVVAGSVCVAIASAAVLHRLGRSAPQEA